MQLTSTAFANGGSIPSLYTCSGQSISPPLAWSHIPTRTRELELLVTDPDAPSGAVSHWVLYDIPPTDHHAPQGSPPPGAQQGVNTFGPQSYLPPCPIPPRSIHHYTFELFATNQRLNFSSPPPDADIRAALKGHILATARLIGTYALA
jgi:Raf kinase inhibitor-like YbhB/YbcL family protein